MQTLDFRLLFLLQFLSSKDNNVEKKCNIWQKVTRREDFVLAVAHSHFSAGEARLPAATYAHTKAHLFSLRSSAEVTSRHTTQE